MPSIRSRLRKALTLVLAAQFAQAWPLATIAASSVSNDVTRATTYSAQIERSLNAIEDGRRQTPRDRWDPQYVVDTYGIDPAALFAFVRDNVTWVPYRGSLRGPVGVLMDRNANSLDMSLLLADLVARSGRQVRLAHGTLSNDKIEILWRGFEANAAAMRARPRDVEVGVSREAEPRVQDPVSAPATATVPPSNKAASAPPASAPVPPSSKKTAPAAAKDAGGSAFSPMGGAGSMFEQLTQPDAPPATNAEAAELYELDKAAAERKLAAAASSRASDANELDQRTVEQGDRLLAMLKSEASEARKSKESERARAALQDHWWVQVESKGAWIDYDPLNPDGSPNKSMTAATETLSPNSLPQEQKHRVRLRVVAEQLRDGKLSENSIFEHDFDPSQVIGKRIALRHLPLLWPSDWDAITPDDVQEKLFAALLTQKEWMPSLTVDGEGFQQASILDTGVINPDPQPRSNPFLSLAFPAAGKVGRVADLFDQMLAEQASPEDLETEKDAGEKARTEGELTAEWLEYTIDIPGEKPKTVRREIFDILGPALRQSGELANFRIDEKKRLARAGGEMTETDLVILPCWPAATYLADKTAELALANKSVLKELSRDPFGKSPPNSIEMFSKMTGMAAPAYLYSALRSEVRATIGSVFIDRPQIVAQHGVLTRVGPGELTAKAALDVIENGVGADPFGDDAFKLRMLQGVADTNAEAIALSGNGENVGEAFKLAGAAGTWTIFRRADRDRLKTLGLPPDLTARLLSDLDAGHAVVAPPPNAPAKERVGWWRVDLATGTTLGMGNRGWGQDLVEYAFQLTIQVMMAQIACMAYTAAGEARDWGFKKLGIDGDDEQPPKNSDDDGAETKAPRRNPEATRNDGETKTQTNDTRPPANNSQPPRNNTPPAQQNTPPPPTADSNSDASDGPQTTSNPKPAPPPPEPDDLFNKEPRKDPFETEFKELPGVALPQKQGAGPKAPQKPNVTHVEVPSAQPSAPPQGKRPAPTQVAPKESAKSAEDARRLDAIRQQTDNRKAADSAYRDAIVRSETTPNAQNQAAVKKAKVDYDRARSLEVDAWRRAGGKGSPPEDTKQPAQSPPGGGAERMTTQSIDKPAAVATGRSERTESLRLFAANTSGGATSGSQKTQEQKTEEGRQKIKQWARNCVSQALLESIAGLSTSWIQSRFIEGAKVPTWNDRAKSSASHTPSSHLPSLPHDTQASNTQPHTNPPGEDHGPTPSKKPPPSSHDDSPSSHNSNTPPPKPPTAPSNADTSHSPKGSEHAGDTPRSNTPPPKAPTSNSEVAHADGSKPPPSSGDAVTQRKPNFEDDQLPSKYPNGPTPPDKVARSEAPSTQRSPGNGVDPLAPTERSPVPPTQRAPDPLAPTERAPAPPTMRSPGNDSPDQIAGSKAPPSSGDAVTQRKPNFEDEQLPSKYPKSPSKTEAPPTERSPGNDGPHPAGGSKPPPSSGDAVTQRKPNFEDDQLPSKYPNGPTPPDKVARSEAPSTQRSPGNGVDPLAPTERSPVPPTQRAPDPLAPTERSPVPPTQRAPDPLAQTERSPVPPTQRAPDPLAPTERSPVPPTQRAPDPLAPTERAPAPPTMRSPGNDSPDQIAGSKAPPSSGDAVTQRKPNFEDEQLPSKYPKSPSKTEAPPTERSPGNDGPHPAGGSKPPPSSGDAVTQRKPNFEDDQLPSKYPNGPTPPDKVARSEAPSTQRSPGNGVDPLAPTERSPVPPTQRAPDPLAPTERSPVPPTQRAPDPLAQTERSPVPPADGPSRRPRNDAERLAAIQAETNARVTAEKSMQQAEQEFKADPTPENYAAFAEATKAATRAHAIEQDAWARVGGTSLHVPEAPRMDRLSGNDVSPMAKSTPTPGKLLQQPALADTAPSTKPGIGPSTELARVTKLGLGPTPESSNLGADVTGEHGGANATLAMGLSNLASTIQKGP